MDQRIESFLADVLALAGEELDVVRDEVRVALGDYAAIFWAQEPNKLMKDKAVRGCRVLCRDRVAEELEHRRGTPIAEHLKLVLTIIDRQVQPCVKRKREYTRSCKIKHLIDIKERISNTR